MTASAGNVTATAAVHAIQLAGAIAFTRASRSTDGRLSFDVLVYSAGTRSAKSLPRPDHFSSIASPAWSPDGSMLAVEVRRDVIEDYENHVLVYQSDVYILDAAASAESPWRALTRDGLSRNPSWAPDGTRLAYVRGSLHADSNHIYLVGATGGTPERLTASAGAYSHPRWSPDGTRLAFVDGRVGSSDIFIVNADGSGLTNVTRSPASDFAPSWSPDGARLTFVSNRESREFDLFVVDVDGGNLRRLRSGGWTEGPVWSPDGRYIAAGLVLPQSEVAIFVFAADGASRVQLTRPPARSGDFAPAWKR